MTTVSERIAEWVQNTNYDCIPHDVVKVAKRCILDFIGVTIAGSKEPTAQIIKQYMNEVKGREESTVIGLGMKASCTEAAFANGVVGHCLDYEDYLVPMPGAGGPHITAVIFPAALAIAEKEEKTGRELIEAYVLGCEVAYRLGRAVEPTHFNLGWHNTETQGIFGAVVAASKLLNLNCEQITYALGITGSEASGLRENFGTMTKPFHSGQSNAKGVRAAMLAKFGFTSAKTIFEGKSGFFNVLCKEVRVDELTEKLGKPFGLPQVKMKLYPCCGGAHSSIDATLDLVNLHHLDSENVAEVTAKCPTLVSEVLIYENPTTGLEGKFSLQFPLALALSERRVVLNQFTDDKVKEPRIVNLMKKIRLVPTPELEPFHSPAIVEIKLKTGEKLIKRVDHRRGTSQNPLSDEELFQKFRSCARLLLSEKETEASLELLKNLENIEDLSTLSKLIMG
jgi:2-methylcitrate dehydratase PrpD